MEDAKQKRLATQPHGARSAGCFFKNPPGTNFGTGKMIDEMGMKGERRGGALVSPVHANFIVTEGRRREGFGRARACRRDTRTLQA